jgi:hypothetical protein
MSENFRGAMLLMGPFPFFSFAHLPKSQKVIRYLFGLKLFFIIVFFLFNLKIFGKYFKEINLCSNQDESKVSMNKLESSIR